MEDHKRKNKKKNQNKRPNAEQIKKLQTVNGVAEEKPNGTSSARVHETSQKPELKVEVRAPVDINRKNKKKNKQQKVKQEGNENDIPTMNGHDHKNSNGVHEKTIEKIDNIESKDESHSDNSQTVAASLETVTDQIDGTCSRSSFEATSPCHPHHGQEAPTCSHHIQHHVNNINTGDFKIDFDVQKHLSPMGSPITANKEYFYKGYNVEKSEDHSLQLNMKNDQVSSSQEIVQKVQPEPTKQNDESSFHNGDKSPVTSEVPVNAQLPFGQKTFIDSIFVNNSNQQQPKPFQPNDIMKAMFGTQEGHPAFNPEEMLKSMLGSGDKNANLPFNPADIFSSMMNTQSGPENLGVNPDLVKTLKPPSNASDETLKSSPLSCTGKTFNPQDMMENMFQAPNNNNAQMNPNDILKNMFQKTTEKGGTISNPAAIFEAMLGTKVENSTTVPDPDDVPIPDIFSQMNAMAQQMDPNMMNGMGQMVANMDPNILMGVNNMVSSMMQGGGLNLQNIMQIKANRPQKSQTEEGGGDVFQSTDLRQKIEINKASEAEQKTSPLVENIASCNGQSSIDPETKCFSFSSLTSEQSEESNNESKSSKEEENIDEHNQEPRKVLRFERDESIPELLENLSRTNSKKEVTTERAEVKTNKIKTIINKVLKKENKNIDGSVISSIDYREQRVEYQKEPSKAKKVVIDYEKLQQVKEPLEVRGNHQKNSKANLKQLSSGLVKNEKEEGSSGENAKKAGESNTDDIKFIESTEQMVIDDNVDFNLESMNEIFTNLLQGRKVTQEINKPPLDVENNNAGGTSSGSPFDSILKQNMSNLFNNLMGQQNTSNESNLMQSDMFQNLQQAMMKQFAAKNSDDESGPFKEDIFGNMADVFDKLISNKDGNSIPDFQELFSKQENMTEILKMSEMLFGTSSPIDLAGKSEDTNQALEQITDSEKTSSLVDTPLETEEDHADGTPNLISKNVHQDERPSFLLKQLLGEKFWSIKKKDTSLKENSTIRSDKKNKKIKARKEPITIASTLKKEDEPSTSNEMPPLSSELQLELEKESPLVRMLHKRLQKDTKLQQFLKDKLKKDPKMQKFIQERLQKDERIQKFMREKLSHDKALRESFEEKFKNELGLTNIVPKFDDEEDTKAGPSNEKTEEREPTECLSEKIPKSKKDVPKMTTKKINTGLLLKTYLELMCLLVVIVYTAILCY